MLVGNPNQPYIKVDLDDEDFVVPPAIPPQPTPLFDPAQAQLRYRAKARLLLLKKQQEEKYRLDPWPFLVEQVLTEDPHDPSGKIKPFPPEPYLKRIVEVWLQEKKLVLPKSRRMLISWLFICLHVWLLLFHKHEHIYFAARKEGRDESQGSLELVKRAKFVINNLRSFKPPITEQKRGRIYCPSTQSEIVAVAEGANQLRQLAATAIFADELAFWEKAQETYAAAMPTIEASGRFTGVSSAHPGFFERLCYDKL